MCMTGGGNSAAQAAVQNIVPKDLGRSVIGSAGRGQVTPEMILGRKNTIANAIRGRHSSLIAGTKTNAFQQIVSQASELATGQRTKRNV